MLTIHFRMFSVTTCNGMEKAVCYTMLKGVSILTFNTFTSYVINSGCNEQYFVNAHVRQAEGYA